MMKLIRPLWLAAWSRLRQVLPTAAFAHASDRIHRHAVLLGQCGPENGNTAWAQQFAFSLAFAFVVAVVARWCFGLNDGETLFLTGNTFATPDWVMRKTARRLVNNCVFAGTVMRDYDDEYRDRGVKKGDTIRLRLPMRYEVTTGAVLNSTPLTDQTVNLSITDQSHIAFEYDSWAATLEVDDYMERYGAPAVDQLINHIDQTGLSRMYKQVAKVVGTPGTVPTTNDVYTLAKTKMVEASVPRPYNALLTADMHGKISNANLALFNPSAQISAFFRTGQFSGSALGIERWFEDENADTHTVGALGGTPLVNGAGQTQNIAIDGVTASVAGWGNEGDVVQFATVKDINLLSRRSTGRLKDNVLSATVDSTAGSAATLGLGTALVASGNLQNCSNLPGNNDAVTIFGHASAYAGVETRQGLVYHKEAFALVMADLILPRGIWISERISNKKLGISIRMVKDYSIGTDVAPARFDTAHGWGAIREHLASRVCS